MNWRSDVRLVMFSDVCQLDVPGEPLELGDSLPVYRGGGPRDGELMGTATVVGLHPDGSPSLEVALGG